MAGEDRKLLQTLVILTSAILILSLISAGATFFVIMSKTTPATKKVIVEKPELGPIQSLGEFVVNLADPTETHYLRANVVLELDYGSSLKLAEEVDKRMPQIKDIVIATLGSKTSIQLADAENREALKQELKDKINAILNRGQLARVYFTSFAIQ
ncbi:MAG: flagellar basal body-associated FliL family protein [Candidatus Goldbacteria bacterium]|nr:flagellar basal body-associated FliL family protein [Candidatus Goldiibacteriota bacterium]